jgi:hypothetical protein
MYFYSVTGKIPLPKFVKYFVIISDAVRALHTKSVHHKDEKTYLISVMLLTMESGQFIIYLYI